MPKICFITPHVYPHYRGGAEIQVSHLCHEFLDRGWEVVHLAESDKAMDVKLDPRIKLILMPKRKRNLKFLLYPTLKKILNSELPDAIYVRPVLHHLFSAAVIGKSIGAEVVWACSSDSKLKRSYMLTGQGLMGLLNYQMFRWAVRNIGHRVVQTPYQQQELFDNYGVGSVVIPNSHPLPQQVNDIPRKNQVIWVGRSASIKNPMAFIEMAKRFINSGIEFRMIVSVVDTELWEAMRSEAGKILNLTLHSDLDNGQVLQDIAASQLLANTSDSEGFSNTFIEAWMRGVPVVSFNADPDELLSSGRCGVLCRDLDHMAKVIEELLGDKSRWESLSKSCVHFATSELSIATGVDRLEKILQLNGSQASAQESKMLVSSNAEKNQSR